VNCRHCQEPVLPDFAFCENCGWPTREQSAATADAPATTLAGPPCICGGATFDSDGYCESCGRKPAPHDACEVQTIDDVAASASHLGRQHDENQDAAGLLRLADGGVAMVVADGVSTACRSRLAAETAVQEALRTLADNQALEPRALLATALLQSHKAICQLPYDDLQLAEPQTTVVLALVRHDVVWYAWVGDSRIYLLHEAASRLLSVDDSWLNERLREGVSDDVAAASGYAHCITQCLGMRDAEPEIHVASTTLPSASWLVLCSDGLWNYFPDAADLWSRLNAADSTRSLAPRCQDLVVQANRAGGSDNVTVAIYRHRS
jgi:serine/threonine protein phosphatase PrpC